ncbi:MAG: cysteine hydrolase [Bdellovibrionales bacterium]|nr:cysteine hydrolase [Bdellovibrionales bacterium]
MGFSRARSLAFLSLLLLPLATQSFATGREQTALIIIDMQPHFITRGGHENDAENRRKIRELLDEQLAAIASARRANMPIVFIEYTDSGSTNTELTAAASGYPNVATFPKDTDGMFDSGNSHRQALEDHLRRQNVRNLVITGANGGACVEQSIRGALAASYNVTAVSRGIADFNYDEYIYPYPYEDGAIKPSCTNCVFRQVDGQAAAFPANGPTAEVQAGGTQAGRAQAVGGDATGRAGCTGDHSLTDVNRLCDEVKGAIQEQGD